ncbi:MAG: ErfK/YbiS/YcfS/YnhG family protein [Modestobacter sp.]|nr:ErfK/YbiS/YcfS/YnhG family protein [Modestobacter sp.]
MHAHRSAARRALPLLAAAVLFVAVLVSSTASFASSAAPPASSTPRPTSGTSVHVSLFENDGRTYGVGMPIIAYFDKKVTDATVFDRIVTVTVNGRPAGGAWYWEPPSRFGAGIEAHYRTAQYWPGHAAIHVSMPIRGLRAGRGLTYGNDVTLDMSTGAAHLATVDGTRGVDTMTISSDGRPVRTVPVSLGKATTPTYLGTKVVMAKANPQEMKSNPGEKPPYDIEVPWSVRVTDSGEFIHDAYWNDQIGKQNLSHGCTNLRPADAEWYYNWSLIGDPVTWVHTGTSQTIPVTDGWGDWNLDWPSYSQGGLLPPR